MKRWYHRLRQDFRVFRALFPWRVVLALVLGTGVMALIFQSAYQGTYGREIGDLSYVKAVYAVINMATFQISFADMPPGPRLDIFFVVVPLVGIPLLLIFGANLLHVVRVFFVRRERGQIWQRALAATIDQPVVVLGLGHIGYRVAIELLNLGRPVIGLDKTDSPLVQSLMDRNMPVLLGDARDKETLESAGVARATVVVVCTYDDLANIEAAFHVRELNREARVVLRLFEDSLFGNIGNQFQVEAILSRSAIAAKAFAYAALGIEALETFGLGDETYVLTEVPLTATSALTGQSLQQIATAKQVMIVCLYRRGELYVEPGLETVTKVDDVLFLFAHLKQLPLLTNGTSAEQAPQHRGAVLVCGLGHTGYRVVKTLHDLGRPVVALDFEPGPLSERLQELGIPIVYGDFRRPSVLESAGMVQAEALVACADDDMVNLEAGMRAREIGPGARVVMRIFEGPLGRQIEQAFGIDGVYSTSALAAPAFVAAALDIHVTERVALAGSIYHMARIAIEPVARLCGTTIGALTEQEDVTVLLYKQGNRVQIPPDPTQHLKSGDEIVVLATREKLRELSLQDHQKQTVR
ncbi:MAG: potassium channel protein [Anaerolineae bacterium]|nr:potassium channel protein [Anaerolineae bacterium]